MNMNRKSSKELWWKKTKLVIACEKKLKSLKRTIKFEYQQQIQIKKKGEKYQHTQIKFGQTKMKLGNTF